MNKMIKGLVVWLLLSLTVWATVARADIPVREERLPVKLMYYWASAYLDYPGFVPYFPSIAAASSDLQSRIGVCNANVCITETNFKTCDTQPYYIWSQPYGTCSRYLRTYGGTTNVDTIEMSIRLQEATNCPNGFSLVFARGPDVNGLYNYGDYCHRVIQDIQVPTCPNDCSAPPQGGRGDPIYPQDGTKREFETDYRDPQGSLSYTRIYNSDRGAFASPYDIALVLPYQITGHLCYASITWVNGGLVGPACMPFTGVPGEITLRTPAGAVHRFLWDGTTATPVNGYLTDQLIQQVQNGITTWIYRQSRTGRILTFNVQGQLIQMTDRSGRFRVLTYSDSTTSSSVAPDAGYLISVTDNMNRALRFTYDSSGNLATLNDPAGHVISYQYVTVTNASQCIGSGCAPLATVTYPDGGVRSYLWNEPAYALNPPADVSNHALLTGVVDENNQRYSTTTYNGVYATATWLADGVDKYTISNFTPFQTATVTDPLGSQRTLTYSYTAGLSKLASVGGGPCPECEASSQVFDVNGNVVGRTDFNSFSTSYTYDLTRNLETSRTEAAGTAQARTITTTWHPTFNLPAQVTEPNRVTNYTYDANGNLLTKAVTASGATRSWNYTYNNFGQVLTATDPDSNKTTYTYDSSGNLTTLTDAKGHVTQFTSYDPNGNLLAMTDPNGKVTTFTWDARNRLKSRQSGSDLTSYTYDLVGQLTNVVFPDGSSVSYTYDPAHRLTNIADSHGNSIAYTLDAAGNHTREDVSDPAGQLAAAQSHVSTSQSLPNVVTQ